MDYRGAPLRVNLLLATRNQGKVMEIRELLSDLPVVLTSLVEYANVPEVIEDRETFRGNAVKKANEVCAATGLTTLADDSGLCVDALDGAPGVKSSRYFGPSLTDARKVELLLERMRGIPERLRTARFRCVAAMTSPSGGLWVTEGAVEGVILDSPRGAGGFGYDPIFYVPELGKSFAELSREEKSKISHRGEAFRTMRRHIIAEAGELS